MITFKEFKSAVDSLSKINNYINILEKAGINISETDLVQESWKLFDMFIDSHFTEKGCDLVYWWIYEDVSKVIYQDTFFGKEEINVEDINDFWSYLKSYNEIYFK